MTDEPNDVLDWDDMSDVDKARAQELLDELNEIFDHYRPLEDKFPKEIN